MGHRDNNHVPTEYLTCQQIEFKVTNPNGETVAVDIQTEEESIPQDTQPCLIVQEADLNEEGASVGKRENNHVPTKYLTCPQIELKVTNPNGETVAVDIKTEEESIPEDAAPCLIVQGSDL